MAYLTATQVAGYAKQAGFSGNNLITAVAVAMAESSGNASSAEWRRNNPDSYIRSVAKRRAHVSFDVDDRDLRRLMLRQMSKCNHCGVYLDKNVSRFVHLDHIVPLSRGGTHSIGNLQYLCQSCNVRKLDRLEVEVRFGVIYRRGKEVVS